MNVIAWIFDLKNVIIWNFDLKNVIVWNFDLKNVIVPNIGYFYFANYHVSIFLVTTTFDH